ncbi:MAG: aldolase [Oscillibacter sp.]|jgi:L-fuculose-phosphate aldolase|nr:aldolase [Oscillibacter sp.]
MIMERERKALSEYGRRLSAAGLTPGTSGNLSVYDPETGRMAVSPSGRPCGEFSPESAAVLDETGRVLEGWKPTSEWSLHQAFYRRHPEARAVVHTHSMYCTTFAVLHRPLEAVHYMILSAGCDEIPWAPYRTFGTPELAEIAVETCGEGKAVLLANHGLVVWEESLEKACALAMDLEFLAELQYHASCIGEPVVLGPHQRELARERFKTYGQAEERQM